MEKLGFIGLGIMGLPMAINILKKSQKQILAFDVSTVACNKFKEAGGCIAVTEREIYEDCDVVFLCLPKNELVENVVTELIAVRKKEGIVVDFSSTSPNVIRGLYEAGQKVGVSVIDSPVSGGEIGATTATLAVMCGGDQAVFDLVEPLIACVANKVTYMGGSGCGDIAKLANNMIVGCNLMAMSEAFSFATKAGLDPETLFLAIKDGFAQNRVMDLKVPKVLSRDFTASARIAVHQKDMNNAIRYAEEMEVALPMSNIVLDYMNRMEEAGLIDEDQCALVKMYEADMGIEVK